MGIYVYVYIHIYFVSNKEAFFLLTLYKQY